MRLFNIGMACAGLAIGALLLAMPPPASAAAGIDAPPPLMTLSAEKSDLRPSLALAQRLAIVAEGAPGACLPADAPAAVVPAASPVVVMFAGPRGLLPALASSEVPPRRVSVGGGALAPPGA